MNEFEKKKTASQTATGIFDGSDDPCEVWSPSTIRRRCIPPGCRLPYKVCRWRPAQNRRYFHSRPWSPQIASINRLKSHLQIDLNRFTLTGWEVLSCTRWSSSSMSSSSSRSSLSEKYSKSMSSSSRAFPARVSVSGLGCIQVGIDWATTGVWLSGRKERIEILAVSRRGVA